MNRTEAQTAAARHAETRRRMDEAERAIFGFVAKTDEKAETARMMRLRGEK